jgi:hypothetical protein
MPTKSVHVIDGHAYVLQGKGSWRNAKDERWDTEMVTRLRSVLIGRRYIDGYLMDVFQGVEYQDDRPKLRKRMILAQLPGRAKLEAHPHPRMMGKAGRTCSCSRLLSRQKGRA